MSNTEGNTGPQEDGTVKLSVEEYNKLLDGQKKAAAMQAGFDMSNPVTELVLDKHWTQDVSIEDLKAFGAQYKVISAEGDEGDEGEVPPPPEPKVTEVTGNQDAGQVQSMLSGGTSVNGQITTPDPDKAVETAYKSAIEKGMNREDAQAVALTAVIATTGQKHVLDRIRRRNEDQQKAQAIIAGAEAQTGAGS